MTVSIKQHFKHHPVQEEIELKRVVTAILADLTAMQTTMADYKAIYDAHVHTADGNAALTSIPDSGTPVGTPSAASVFTDSTTSLNLIA
jgi:hypothetical protein